MIEVKFEGTQKLNSALKKMCAKCPKEFSKFMKQEAELVKGRAKKLTPAKTGYLRGGWDYEVTGNTAIIYDPVEYAPYVEWGHRVKVHGKFTGAIVPGAHMLQEAVESSAAKFNADAAKILQRIFAV